MPSVGWFLTHFNNWLLLTIGCDVKIIVKETKQGLHEIAIWILACHVDLWIKILPSRIFLPIFDQIKRSWFSPVKSEFHLLKIWVKWVKYLFSRAVKKRGVVDGCVRSRAINNAHLATEWTKAKLIFKKAHKIVEILFFSSS